MCLIGLEAFVGYGMGGIPLQSVFLSACILKLGAWQCCIMVRCLPYRFWVHYPLIPWIDGTGFRHLPPTTSVHLLRICSNNLTYAYALLVT
jgi:hypothetical protein